MCKAEGIGVLDVYLKEKKKQEKIKRKSLCLELGCIWFFQVSNQIFRIFMGEVLVKESYFREFEWFLFVFVIDLYDFFFLEIFW